MASLVICDLFLLLSCCWMELRGCVTPAILERLAIATVNNITGFQDLKFVNFLMLWSFLEIKSCLFQAFRPAKNSPSDITTSYWSRRYSRNSQKQTAQFYSCNAKYWLWTDKFQEKGASRSSLSGVTAFSASCLLSIRVSSSWGRNRRRFCGWGGQRRNLLHHGHQCCRHTILQRLGVTFSLWISLTLSQVWLVLGKRFFWFGNLVIRMTGNIALYMPFLRLVNAD